MTPHEHWLHLHRRTQVLRCSGVPPFGTLDYRISFLPLTRATVPATGISPQQLQGEFIISFRRFAPATGSLRKRRMTTTPLHSFSHFENNKRSHGCCQDIDGQPIFFNCFHGNTLQPVSWRQMAASCGGVLAESFLQPSPPGITHEKPYRP